jgi:hypothetical protein
VQFEPVVVSDANVELHDVFSLFKNWKARREYSEKLAQDTKILALP